MSYKKHYPDKLYVTPLDDGISWEMNENYRYYSDVVCEWITVPKGFVFDFASIPKLAWSIVGAPATGLHRFAAVVHDYIYSTQKYSREICDKIFLEAMTVSGVVYWKRKTMYYAVRIGGSRAYNELG